MRDGGASATDVYVECKRDGLGLIDSIRALRFVFGLSMKEGKEVCIKFDTGQDLNTMQQGLVQPVLDALKHFDK